MKYQRIYCYGGSAGKDETGDFVSHYIAENRARIEVDYFGNRVLQYRFMGKAFSTLKSAKEACDAHKLTPEEWADMHRGEHYRCVWAADTNAGFGKKGDSVYGTSPCTYIVRDERIDDYNHVLHLWNSALGALSKEEQRFNRVLRSVWTGKTVLDVQKITEDENGLTIDVGITEKEDADE